MRKFREKYFATNEEMPQTTQIENILYQDEHIVEHLTPNKRAYIWSQLLFNISTILIWLLVDSLFIFLIVKGQIYNKNPELSVFLTVFFIFHLYPVWDWLYRIVTTILNLRHEEYYITNQRIIVKTGIKRVNYKSVYIDNIYDIKIKVNFIDKRLKVGDIIISSQLTDIDFDRTQAPKETKNLVLFDQQYPQDKVTLIQNLKKELQNYRGQDYDAR